MSKKQILFLTSILLAFLVFSFRTAFSEPALDRRFPKDIAQIPLPKLLDFGAGKCIPCKAMAPILKELAEEYNGRVIIKVIEIYDEGELTRVNRIRLIPTQIFFDAKNKEVFRHEGFMNKAQIKKVFEAMGVK